MFGQEIRPMQEDFTYDLVGNARPCPKTVTASREIRRPRCFENCPVFVSAVGRFDRACSKVGKKLAPELLLPLHGLRCFRLGTRCLRGDQSQGPPRTRTIYESTVDRRYPSIREQCRGTVTRKDPPPTDLVDGMCPMAYDVNDTSACYDVTASKMKELEVAGMSSEGCVVAWWYYC